MFSKKSLEFFSSPIGTVLLSAAISILTSVIINQITESIRIKRKNRNRLSEICKEYEQESIKLRQEFRIRIVDENTGVAITKNYWEAHFFNQKIIDDNELNKLLLYFKINQDGLNNVLHKYEKAREDDVHSFYDIVDEIKKEFLKIDKQI